MASASRMARSSISISGEKGYYHANADLVIVDGTALDNDGNIVLLPPGVITEKVMYDAREGGNIRLTEIDMELLGSSGNFPANGLLYAYRTDSTPGQPNGIRLTNGEELASPLTVVTEDPITIHGDYNTINKVGSAVMADAVNLLSNAWDDSKGPGSLPSAVDTQFNICMVSGNVPTPDGGGNYSGGFENMPRFHERWSGRRATIRGSFISLYESEFGVSPWRYGGDVYTAPIRDWRFDPDLLEMGNLPPFTPNALSWTVPPHVSRERFSQSGCVESIEGDMFTKEFCSKTLMSTVPPVGELSFFRRRKMSPVQRK